MRLRLFLVLGFLWGVGCDLLEPQYKVERTVRVLDPERQPILSPLQVTDGAWVDVSAGLGHTCAIRKDGSLWCWGWFFIADNLLELPFLRVGGEGEWALVRTLGVTCAIRADRTLWCWGEVKLWNGIVFSYSDNPSVPVLVDANSDWVQLEVGIVNACGIREDRSLWCWGSNYNGALGIGKEGGFASSPTEVTGGGKWITVTSGLQWLYPSTWGIREDSTLWRWGEGLTVPTQVGTDHDWVKVSAGHQHVCALKGNGTLWCGDGASFTPVTAETGWVQVSVGWFGFTCVLKEDHTLWCWGDNSYGQLGVGDQVDRSFPTQVGTDHDWVKVSAGYQHACALKENGTLWCWGDPRAVRIKGTTSP